MSSEVRVPALPESVADATVLTWHKQAGEAVRKDDNLVDLETDKVVLEVPAPIDGVLTERMVAEGEVVEAEAILALIDPNASATTAPASASAATASQSQTAPAQTASAQTASTQTASTQQHRRP
jgi:2-oxoglutarate dehydrogenase E2 component (dihydrolipoamide succinyltransferase)